MEKARAPPKLVFHSATSLKLGPGLRAHLGIQESGVAEHASKVFHPKIQDQQLPGKIFASSQIL
jgi:hypothetical protein